MHTELLQDALIGRAQVVPLSIHQYHRMLESGILAEGESIELLDGFLVRKDRSATGGAPMTVGPKHRLVVDKLMRYAVKLEREDCHVQIQAPLTLPPDQEPEPDACIVRGRPADYADRHPGPADVYCAIEVAESSLHRDRTTKQRIYARAGVPQYLIINLLERVIEAHEDPQPESGRYGLMRVLRIGDVAAVFVGTGTRVEVDVADWLP